MLAKTASVITAQLALLVYIALFAAGIKLHYDKPHVARSFCVPGKKLGMWIVCTGGIAASVAVILFGFLPPSAVPFQSVFIYELILIIGIAICCIAPLYLIKWNKVKN